MTMMIMMRTVALSSCARPLAANTISHLFGRAWEERAGFLVGLEGGGRCAMDTPNKQATGPKQMIDLPESYL